MEAVHRLYRLASLGKVVTLQNLLVFVTFGSGSHVVCLVLAWVPLVHCRRLSSLVLGSLQERNMPRSGRVLSRNWLLAVWSGDSRCCWRKHRERVERSRQLSYKLQIAFRSLFSTLLFVKVFWLTFLLLQMSSLCRWFCYVFVNLYCNMIFHEEFHLIHLLLIVRHTWHFKCKRKPIALQSQGCLNMHGVIQRYVL